MSNLRSTRFANTAVAIHDKNGNRRIYSHCTLCGKWHNEDLGLRIDYHITRSEGSYRVDLCKSCLKKVDPTLQQLFSIIEDRSEYQNDVSEIGLQCQEKLNSVIEAMRANYVDD